MGDAGHRSKTMKFIWTDFETTGLDPGADVPLALGLIITEGLDKEIARAEWTIGWHCDHPALRYMSDYVRSMHDRSGLLARVANSWTESGRFTVDNARCTIGAWLRSHLGEPLPDPKERPAYAGNTVSFDKAFMEEWFPEAARWFSYRCLDVSSFKLLAMATIPGAAAWNASRPEAAHTPLADLEASMAELAHWRAELARPPDPREAEYEARYSKIHRPGCDGTRQREGGPDGPCLCPRTSP